MSKNFTIFVILLIIVGVTGTVIFSQFYNPEEKITGPISVVDDVGRNVTITEYPPKRIVSMAASCTEILFALELGDKVVGVDQYSDYPQEVKDRVDAGNLTIVGSFAEISIEMVMSLQPDLVMATGGVQRVVVESLEGLGQPVVVLYPYGKGFDGMLGDITLVGKITGQNEEAEALVADMEKRVQEIADKTQDAAKPRVYVEYFFNGGYWSYGGGSYVNDLISLAGGTNVFSGFELGYLETSTEEILKANPEVIVISQGDMAMACGLTPETIKERLAWSEISAIQNNRIYEIDEDILSRPGPRMANALETLANLLHPELFS